MCIFPPANLPANIFDIIATFYTNRDYLVKSDRRCCRQVCRQTLALNRAARDWHQNYFAELVANGMICVAAFSQELVLPPDNPPSAVWAQRFPDGQPVETATGFGNKNSSHCAFARPFRDYIKKAYEEIAGHMEAAGLTAWLQFGEVLWWYFANASGMAFYDAYTTTRFQTQYGRPLHTFLTPSDDPSVNGYVDANFLRQTVKDHVEAIRSHVLATHPNAKFELLWPLDVNDPATRRLNRYINLPVDWETKAGSGFDTFLIEGFQFAGIDRNLAKVRWMAGYPFEVLSWPPVRRAPPNCGVGPLWPLPTKRSRGARPPGRRPGSSRARVATSHSGRGR
jgi:hypothetical protein